MVNSQLGRIKNSCRLSASAISFQPNRNISPIAVAESCWLHLSSQFAIEPFCTSHECHATRFCVTTTGKDRTDWLADSDPLSGTGHVLDTGILEPRAGVSDHDVSRRKDHCLANGTKWTGRSREVEFRQRARGTRFCVHAEYRNFVRAFHELHRRTPARIHFDRVRLALSGHEIDAIDADEIELFNHRSRQNARPAHEFGFGPVIVLRQNASTIPIAIRAEGALSHQLSGDAERHHTLPGCNEHNRAWRALDEFLKVVARRHSCWPNKSGTRTGASTP